MAADKEFVTFFGLQYTARGQQQYKDGSPPWTYSICLKPSCAVLVWLVQVTRLAKAVAEASGRRTSVHIV